MSENATLFFDFACIFLAFAIVSLLMKFDIEGKYDKNGRPSAAILFMFMSAVAVTASLAYYSKGQVNKTLPNLKARGCEDTRVLHYPLGVDYHSELAKLEKSQHNTHCKETIRILYQGNEPIVIALK